MTARLGRTNETHLSYAIALSNIRYNGKLVGDREPSGHGTNQQAKSGAHGIIQDRFGD